MYLAVAAFIERAANDHAEDGGLASRFDPESMISPMVYRASNEGAICSRVQQPVCAMASSSSALSRCSI